MPRPRLHDLDIVMDVAEEIAVESGPTAVTVRAVSEATAASNGAIYHAFGSRAGLVGRVWLRAAHRFLAVQNQTVDSALAQRTDGDSAVEAVIAAADTPAIFFAQQPASARLLLTVRRSELLGSSEIPTEIADDLRALDTMLTELLIRLSRRLWNRGDRDAVAVIRDCVVELPAVLLLRDGPTPDATTRKRLAAAVAAMLAVGPPPAPVRPTRTAQHREKAPQ
jgi:AcrR family transcriptional regulator